MLLQLMLLVFVVGTINANPNMTYDECVDLKMMIKVSQLEQIEFSENNQALEFASRFSHLYAQCTLPKSNAQH